MNKIRKQHIADRLQFSDPYAFIDHNGVLSIGMLCKLDGQVHTVFAEISDTDLEQLDRLARMRPFTHEVVPETETVQ